jgi:Na+/H+ antiporter NhaD/arsenite permease-like protein
VFATGLLGLLSVPVFKALTGLPPYLGMLSALGVMWTLTDAIHAGEGKDREELMAPAALKKIDTSGVLFFLGILLSVGALDSAGILRSLAQFLDTNIPNDDIVATIIGIASAIIDNVPLVAATMGMYPLDKIPMDDQLWQLIAFCAGTGGSIFVIGSAAGVALMGLEKVDFVWYAKRISIAALAGYFGGIATYLAQHEIMNFL